jgi:hypothetical protein
MVQLPLHVAGIGSHRHNCTLIGQHNTELTIFTITPISTMATSPKLESIPLIPIAYL